MAYDPRMLRPIAVLAVVTAAACGTPGAVSSAQPDTTSPGPVPCTYVLTPPTVVNVSGTEVVTASLSTGACDGAMTFQTTACLQMAGAGGAGQCAQGRGLLPAQVFFQPYRKGATYIATGRGCASKGNPPQKFCGERGPLSATL